MPCTRRREASRDTLYLTEIIPPNVGRSSLFVSVLI